jgi:hypothetical protein
VDLKIAVAVLVTLTVGLMAVLWLLGKPTHRFAAEIAAAPRRPRWCPGLRHWQARVLAARLGQTPSLPLATQWSRPGTTDTPETTGG